MLASDVVLEQVVESILKLMAVESWRSWRRHCPHAYVKFVYDLKGGF